MEDGEVVAGASSPGGPTEVLMVPTITDVDSLPLAVAPLSVDVLLGFFCGFDKWEL